MVGTTKPHNRPILIGLLQAVLVGLSLFCSPLAVANASAADSSQSAADQLLVKFRSGTDAVERAAVHDANDATLERHFGPERTDLVAIPSDESVAAAAADYEQDPNVISAEPNGTVSISTTPNDLGSSLWGLNNTGQNGGISDADIDAPEGWGLLGSSAVTGSPWPQLGVAVGVIDTGVDRKSVV